MPERKLAKRLVSPDLVCPTHWSGPGWVLTDGPAVAELNASIGFEPDPQQELGLDLIFAVGANGLPASFAFCVICCRQNLKTGLFKQAATGWVFVTDERKVVWSSHEMSTTLAAQAELADLWLSHPATSRRMMDQKNHGVYTDNNATRIEFRTGQQLLFKARTNGGGRGLSGDKVILDEAFALKPSHVGSLIPTMMARAAGQVLYGSSAGKADSTVLLDVRDRGRAKASPRLSYLEWSADRRPCADPDCTHPKNAATRGLGCALDDEQLWRDANPTITTGRISLQTVADARQELPPEEFMRECLGWWDQHDAGASTFGAGRWEACADDIPLPEHPAAIGVAVSVDRMSASIGCAALVEVLSDPADPESEPIEKMLVAPVERRDGVRWLYGWHREDCSADCDRHEDGVLKGIQARHPDAVIIADSGGPTKDLRDDFDSNDIAIEWVDLNEYAEACSRFFDQVREGTLVHGSAAELDAAVEAAAWRWVNDRRVWGRKQSAASGGDVATLEAVTLAGYGAEKFGSAFNIY